MTAGAEAAAAARDDEDEDAAGPAGGARLAALLSHAGAVPRARRVRLASSPAASPLLAALAGALAAGSSRGGAPALDARRPRVEALPDAVPPRAAVGVEVKPKCGVRPRAPGPCRFCAHAVARAAPPGAPPSDYCPQRLFSGRASDAARALADAAARPRNNLRVFVRDGEGGVAEAGDGGGVTGGGGGGGGGAAGGAWEAATRWEAALRRALPPELQGVLVEAAAGAVGGDDDEDDSCVGGDPGQSVSGGGRADADAGGGTGGGAGGGNGVDAVVRRGDALASVSGAPQTTGGAGAAPAIPPGLARPLVPGAPLVSAVLALAAGELAAGPALPALRAAQGAPHDEAAAAGMAAFARLGRSAALAAATAMAAAAAARPAAERERERERERESESEREYDGLPLSAWAAAAPAVEAAVRAIERSQRAGAPVGAPGGGDAAASADAEAAPADAADARAAATLRAVALAAAAKDCSLMLGLSFLPPGDAVDADEPAPRDLGGPTSAVGSRGGVTPRSAPQGRVVALPRGWRAVVDVTFMDVFESKPVGRAPRWWALECDVRDGAAAAAQSSAEAKDRLNRCAAAPRE